MGNIRLLPSLWRARLRPASFRGARFHIDDQSRTSGRRGIVHEFPKRNLPYTEDMGRRARHFSLTGYIISGNYLPLRDRLVAALEQDGPGQLVLSTGLENGIRSVMCLGYAVRESRERGGICAFEMQFAEAGSPLEKDISEHTQSQVQDQSSQTEQSASQDYTARTDAEWGGAP